MRQRRPSLCTGPWLNRFFLPGPAAVPGTYSARLTRGTTVQTQSFTVAEDPRVLRDGVTLEDLKDQFNHNIRARDLVSDVNKTVARVRAAQTRLRAAAGHARI